MERQFVESLMRLYKSKKINEEKIVELFESGKIEKFDNYSELLD